MNVLSGRALDDYSAIIPPPTYARAWPLLSLRCPSPRREESSAPRTLNPTPTSTMVTRITQPRPSPQVGSLTLKTFDSINLLSSRCTLNNESSSVATLVIIGPHSALIVSLPSFSSTLSRSLVARANKIICNTPALAHALEDRSPRSSSPKLPRSSSSPTQKYLTALYQPALSSSPLVSPLLLWPPPCQIDFCWLFLPLLTGSLVATRCSGLLTCSGLQLPNFVAEPSRSLHTLSHASLSGPRLLASSLLSTRSSERFRPGIPSRCQFAHEEHNLYHVFKGVACCAIHFRRPHPIQSLRR